MPGICISAKEPDQRPGEDYDGRASQEPLPPPRSSVISRSTDGAFSEKEVNAAVCYHGPVIMGTNWTEGMMEPNEHGVIRATEKR